MDKNIEIDIEDVSVGNDVVYIATDCSDFDGLELYRNEKNSLEELLSSIKEEIKTSVFDDFEIDTLWIHKVHLIKRIDLCQ
jgi:hypothetical protein